MYENITQRLREVSRDLSITYYSDVAPMAGLDMGLPNDRHQIGMILDEINREEMQMNRPMLSAVVVQKDTLRPGRGFFNLAQSLGLMADGDEERFYSQELRRVHDYWATNSKDDGMSFWPKMNDFVREAIELETQGSCTVADLSKLDDGEKGGLMAEWTNEEFEILLQNPHLESEEFNELLPNRSVGAINWVRGGTEACYKGGDISMLSKMMLDRLGQEA